MSNTTAASKAPATTEVEVTFPFTTTVNESIAQLRMAPFKVGQIVTVHDSLPNGQFVYVERHDKPLHIDRFDLTPAQLACVRRQRSS